MKGIEPTMQEIKDAEKLRMDNYLWLIAAGVPNVLPVIHQHESPELINVYEKLLGPNAYLCVSPANDVQSDGRSVWLDKVFRLKAPDTRVHGLAVFSEKLLMRYNWYSVDAITWFKAPLMGILNRWEFGKSQTIKLENAGKKRLADMQHYGVERIMGLFKSENLMIRDSIRFFMELEKRIWIRTGQQRSQNDHRQAAAFA